MTDLSQSMVLKGDMCQSYIHYKQMQQIKRQKGCKESVQAQTHHGTGSDIHASPDQYKAQDCSNEAASQDQQ